VYSEQWGRRERSGERRPTLGVTVTVGPRIAVEGIPTVLAALGIFAYVLHL
jgi:hypothetical protein